MNAIKKCILCIVCTAIFSSTMHTMLKKSPQIPLTLIAIHAAAKVNIEEQIEKPQYNNNIDEHKALSKRKGSSHNKNSYKTQRNNGQKNYSLQQPSSKK